MPIIKMTSSNRSILLNEIAAAAIVGSIASAMNHFEGGHFKMFRVLVTGFSLAYFAGDDAVLIVQQYFDFQISHGGTVFLVAFFGNEVLDRIISLTRSFKLNKKWSD